MATLHIHLFGQLRLFWQERPYPFKALPKVTPLLAHLLLQRDTPTPRDSLAFKLWPDATEKQAKGRLRRHLYDLRRALPPAPDDQPWLLVSPQTVQWNPAAPHWLDVAAFTHLSRQPQRLAEATALYTGELLPDEGETWLVLPRQQLQSQYQQNLSQLIAGNCRQEDWHQARVYAEQLLHSDAYNEKGMQQLMALLYALGERATAVSRYQQFQQQLEAALDVPPLPETTAVYQAILDKQEITAVFILAELAPEPAAGAKEQPAPGNIPHPLRPLIGRTQALADIVRFLTGDPPARLLTVTGIGGIGKTQLTIAAATKLQTAYGHHFADGCYFVPLASLSDPDQVWTAVADTLHLKVKSPLSPFAAVRGHLRYKQCLLVLDNFEHLLPAAPQLHTLLQTTPQLQVIVTSIIPLRLVGEQEYPLRPLQLPLAVASPADLAPIESVALFTAVAQAASPHFRLDADNAAIVAQICQQLDGIPLAIELAAARSKHFPTAVLRQQLAASQQLLLADTTQTRPARHHSLTAALQWSYDLLSADEKQLLRQLAHFPDGFSLAAVSAICFQQPVTTIDAFDAPVFNRLTQLADKHFIHAASRPCVEGVLRFDILRPIRSFLLAQPGAEVERDWRRRFVTYYADIIWPLAKAWQEAVAKWRLWLDNEAENVRQALNWAIAAEDEAEFALAGVKMVTGMVPYWETAAHLDNATFQIERFDPRLPHCPAAIQIRFLRAAGAIADMAGMPDADAFAYRERALQLAQQLEDQELLCLCLDAYGSSANRRGAFERAEPLLRQALVLEAELNQGQMRYRQASIMMNLSIVIKKQGGDRVEVLQLQEGCVRFLRAQARPSDLAKALLSLCHTYRDVGKHEQAAACLREGLQIGQQLNDRFVQLLFLTAVADHAEFHNRLAACVQLYGAFLTLSQKFNIGWPPYYQDEFARELAKFRPLLTPEAYAIAWEKGARLSLGEAVAFARQTIID